MHVYTTVEANKNLDNRNSVLCSIWKFDERWKHGSSRSLWIPYLQMTTDMFHLLVLSAFMTY